jgi:hypothetical protein
MHQRNGPPSPVCQRPTLIEFVRHRPLGNQYRVFFLISSYKSTCSLMEILQEDEWIFRIPWSDTNTRPAIVRTISKVERARWKAPRASRESGVVVFRYQMLMMQEESKTTQHHQVESNGRRSFYSTTMGHRTKMD